MVLAHGTNLDEAACSYVIQTVCLFKTIECSKFGGSGQRALAIQYLFFHKFALDAMGYCQSCSRAPSTRSIAIAYRLWATVKIGQPSDLAAEKAAATSGPESKECLAA